MTERTATADDGLTEELVNGDYLSIIAAIHDRERDEGAEARLSAFLDDPDGWPSFRRGCDFNALPAEIKEDALRLALRLYGTVFPAAPEAFRRVLTGIDVAHPRNR